MQLLRNSVTLIEMAGHTVTAVSVRELVESTAEESHDAYYCVCGREAVKRCLPARKAEFDRIVRYFWKHFRELPQSTQATVRLDVLSRMDAIDVEEDFNCDNIHFTE